MRNGGRSKGTPNKSTFLVREKLQIILNNCIQNLDLNELNNKERIELIGKILPFLAPKFATIIESPGLKENSIKPTIINL